MPRVTSIHPRLLLRSTLSCGPIMFPCKPFRNNTSKVLRKCSFQKTYTNVKSFRMRTYKKPGGPPLAPIPVFLSFIPSVVRRGASGSIHCLIASLLRYISVCLPLEPRCFPMGNAPYLFSPHIVTWLFPSKRGWVYTPPSKPANVGRFVPSSVEGRLLVVCCSRFPLPGQFHAGRSAMKKFCREAQ
jgi:hypothetical protein